eukprot:TRINITY_DN75524_c0_g1_i1.p1 TRINITY_DN75524_c0_g1~~TRINITY_DN75524_c0_g1_i1.p1  ORF type:complete len:387 (+),score=68.78 TRINITY_DN75524_c0_g1_i1:41-1201(+)
MVSSIYISCKDRRMVAADVQTLDSQGVSHRTLKNAGTQDNDRSAAHCVGRLSEDDNSRRSQVQLLPSGWSGFVGCVGLFLVFVYVACHLRLPANDRHSLSTIKRLRGSPQAEDEIPSPPSPYHYNTFMDWLKHEDFSSDCPDCRWKPTADEYDIEAARHSKFGKWLQGPDAESAIEVAKHINRYVFTKEIARTGDFTVMANTPMHLYILRRLRQAADASKHPTFLDMGCGTGYLLRAWTMLAGSHSRAIGLDLDEKMVAEARKNLQDPDAVDPQFPVPADTKATAFVGNALHPPQGLLVDGLADAINVGVAVESISQLDVLASMLREGGKLAAPICKPPQAQPKDMAKEKCAAQFRILEKSAAGHLEIEPNDPGVEVTFIVARQAS